jgi:hypothetical protein
VERTITIEGYPGFIIEANNTGLFYLVNKISFEVDKPYSWTYEWAENDKGFIVLRKGLDIIEAPNRNVSILAKMSEECNHGFYLVNELKKHADIGGYDYVSLEPFGIYPTNLLVKEGNWKLYEVRPRYFRKVPQDDLM